MTIRMGVLCLSFLGLCSLPGHAKEKAATPAVSIDGQKVQLARYAKSFVGQGNVTVDMAPYKTADGKEWAILLIKGVEGPWDGQAVKHQVVPAPHNGLGYLTTYKGKDWESMRAYADQGEYELYVPEEKNPIKLAPSDGAAQLTTPDAIVKTYLEQQKAPAK